MPYATKERRAEYQKRYRSREVAPEYRSWCAMKSRCLNPHVPRYAQYGAIGITICERWVHSFEHFLVDMGPKPTPKHTIDRIVPSRGYYPENCRWATAAEQAANRRDRIRVVYQGEHLTLQQVSPLVGIKAGTLWRRIVTYGWECSKALTTPLRGSR